MRRLHLDDLDVQHHRHAGQQRKLLDVGLRLHVAVQVQQPRATTRSHRPDAARIDEMRLAVLLGIPTAKLRLQRFVQRGEGEVLADQSRQTPARRDRNFRCTLRRREDLIDRAAPVNAEVVECIVDRIGDEQHESAQLADDIVGVQQVGDLSRSGAPWRIAAGSNSCRTRLALWLFHRCGSLRTKCAR